MEAWARMGMMMRLCAVSVCVAGLVCATAAIGKSSSGSTTSYQVVYQGTGTYSRTASEVENSDCRGVNDNREFTANSKFHWRETWTMKLRNGRLQVGRLGGPGLKGSVAEHITGQGHIFQAGACRTEPPVNCSQTRAFHGFANDPTQALKAVKLRNGRGFDLIADMNTVQTLQFNPDSGHAPCANDKTVGGKGPQGPNDVGDGYYYNTGTNGSDNPLQDINIVTLKQLQRQRHIVLKSSRNSLLNVEDAPHPDPYNCSSDVEFPPDFVDRITCHFTQDWKGTLTIARK